MKLIKRIAAALLVAALAFSFTSCIALDKAKAHHMIYKDKSKNEIVFNDKTYVKMPKVENDLWTKYSGMFDYNVTESDVPVLLSGAYGSIANYDEKLDIITCGENMFCPEADIEKNQKMINDAVIDTVCTVVPGDDSPKLKALPSDTSKAIFEILDDEPLDEDAADSVWYGGYQFAEMYMTNADRNVVSPDQLMLFEYKNRIFIAVNLKDKIYPLTEEIEDSINNNLGEGFGYYVDYNITYDEPYER